MIYITSDHIMRQTMILQLLWTFQFISGIISCTSDDDGRVGSDGDGDDEDFGGGVDDEVFLGDADAPETIEPMGMEKKHSNTIWCAIEQN